MLVTNLLLTNLKCRSIVSAKMTWAVMTIVADAEDASVVEAVVVRDVVHLKMAAVVTEEDKAWTTATLKAEDHLWVTMVKKAAIEDAEEEVVVDSAAAKVEWMVKKPRTVIEVIQVDTVNVAAMLKIDRTMEASTPAVKDNDNVGMTAIATMVVDEEVVVEEEVLEVLDPDTMTVDIRITVAHATMAANVGVVAMVTTDEVEVVAAEVVAASTRVVAVVVAIIKAVAAVAATMVVTSNELLSSELRQVQIVKIAAQRETMIERFKDVKIETDTN